MPFLPSPLLPRLPPIPDVSLYDFMFDERNGRASFSTSLPPYVCGLTGREIQPRQLKDQIDSLARALASELGWSVNEGSELTKVVGIFALNTIDIPALTWAIHRLNGVCAPVSAVFTAQELAHQLRKSKAQALFTVLPLLDVARQAARLCGIAEQKVLLCKMPGDDAAALKGAGFRTLDDLWRKSDTMPPLEPLKWKPGQGKKQIAYLSRSSGTTGPPKVAMISHHNIISNVLQITLYEQAGRGGPAYRDVILGIVPHSRIYGVVTISNLSTWRGDSVVVLPQFSMQDMLASIAKHRINTLCIVPPIVVLMSKNIELLRKYDLSSVKVVVSGAAPLGEETLKRLTTRYPDWVLRQGYGSTETAACACHTDVRDAWAGSSGSVIPGAEIKIVRPDTGEEVTGAGKEGELYIQSPSVVCGYLGDDAATTETIVHDDEGKTWLRTGDIGVFRKKEDSGNLHLFIVDRIKELIKVKGEQVVPAELEDCLLEHPSVADCAVIGVEDEYAGELPKAYVQRLPPRGGEKVETDEALAKNIYDWISERKARFKRLDGGVVFIDAIPKSPAGKTLRRVLRDRPENRRKKVLAAL